MKALVTLYPELEQFDGLPQALRSRLSKVVPDLQYVHGISFSKLREHSEYFERVGIFHLSSKLIASNGNWADIDIAVEQTRYVMTLGVKGDGAVVFLETDTLEKIVEILLVWFDKGVSVAQLTAFDTFVTLLDLTDDSQYIRWQWANYHRQAVNCGVFTRQLAPLFLEAMHDPVLNQITPYTSHSSLFLSRYTEFPFASIDYPIVTPLLSLSIDNYYRAIVQNRNVEEAEKAVLEIPSEIGRVVKGKNDKYEFLDDQNKKVFRGGLFELLSFIVENMNGKYEILDRRGTGAVAENAKQAVDLLRQALPSNWHRSIRGSADDQ